MLQTEKSILLGFQLHLFYSSVLIPRYQTSDKKSYYFLLFCLCCFIFFFYCNFSNSLILFLNLQMSCVLNFFYAVFQTFGVISIYFPIKFFYSQFQVINSLFSKGKKELCNFGVKIYLHSIYLATYLLISFSYSERCVIKSTNFITFK